LFEGKDRQRHATKRHGADLRKRDRVPEGAQRLTHLRNSPSEHSLSRLTRSTRRAVDLYGGGTGSIRSKLHIMKASATSGPGRPKTFLRRIPVRRAEFLAFRFRYST